MLEHAADEVIRQRREAQAPAVRLVEKQIGAGRRVGQMIVHMGTRAGAARERLGHERRDRPRPLGELAGHHPEENQAIGRRQGVGIAKVDLVLEIGVLVVGLIDTPAERGQAVVELPQKTEAPDIPCSRNTAWPGRRPDEGPSRGSNRPRSSPPGKTRARCRH